MPTPLDYAFKFLGPAFGIAVIVAWFYAYAKTGIKGFILIALAGVIKFVGWLSIAILVTFTHMNIPAIFPIIQIVTLATDIVSFVLTIWGILLVVNQLQS